MIIVMTFVNEFSEWLYSRKSKFSTKHKNDKTTSYITNECSARRMKVKISALLTVNYLSQTDRPTDR